MTDIKNTLRKLRTSAPPTLKDRIREHLPEIEIARANRMPWRVIVATLAQGGIIIESQLLANYICQLRKTMRPPKEPEHVGDVPVKPAPPLPEARAMPKQVRGGEGELVRQVAGGLLAPPLPQ